MNKPITNRAAYSDILDIVGTKTELANQLGLAKQLISRWQEVPPQFAEQVADLVSLPIDHIIPETEAKVSEIVGRPSSDLLPALIRVFIRPAKSGAWVKRRRRK